MDTFVEDLLDIMRDPRIDKDARDLASTVLDNWRQGVTPSAKKLKVLANCRVNNAQCKHMQQDGSCGWIRKYGKGYDLPVPPIGEKAKCAFVARTRQCPGFRKLE